MKPIILIIDDDLAVRTSLELLLSNQGLTTLVAANPTEALHSVRSHACDLILMDMNYSRSTTGKEGLKLLNELKNLSPEIPIILMTAWASISLAIEGIKAGAYDFISKPWENEHLLQTIKTALKLAGKTTATPKGHLNRSQLDTRFDFHKIIGESPQMLEILNTVARICATDASILITGESGTGKELIADAIHYNSQRKNYPFIKVNLGGIPATLFESEMFGHKQGAFTDAKSNRIGRFEMAHKGTIFLDEIGDLSLNNQVKLLHVLQEHRFEVLGSSVTQSADFRVIAATNRDLVKMVTDGQFREDLYYRINLVTLHLPPLRERVADIPLLVDYIINRLKQTYHCAELTINPTAIKWLKSQMWPGNVRELKNLLERVVLISDKKNLEVAEFNAAQQLVPTKPLNDALPPVGSVTIDEMEKRLIVQALEFHNGNLSKVAHSLGLSRTALYRRLEKYRIQSK